MSKYRVVLFSFFFLSILVIGSVLASSSDSWTTRAPMQQARAYFGLAAVNEKLYAIGGDVRPEIGSASTGMGFGYRNVSTNEEYDPVANTWTYKTSMPTARASFAIAVYQGKIYCIGGYYSNVTYIEGHVGETHLIDTGINEVYDPATDIWTTKTSMPTPRRTASTNVVNGKIYVIGGYGDLKVIEVYDPKTDSWTTKTSSPYRIVGSASAVIDDKIYLTCQRFNAQGEIIYGAIIGIYDTSNDAWSEGASSPAWGQGMIAAATSGVNAPKVFFFEDTQTHIYNPKTDSWTEGTPLPTARLIPSVAVLNNQFYVIGGRSGDYGGVITMMYPSAANEQYTPADNEPTNPNYSQSVGLQSPKPSYTVPEFPFWVILPVLAIATILIGLIYKRH